MPIAALGLSGHCNGYRATVAVICNNQAYATVNNITNWGYHVTLSSAKNSDDHSDDRENSVND
jgi:hypothetical protein